MNLHRTRQGEEKSEARGQRQRERNELKNLQRTSHLGPRFHFFSVPILDRPSKYSWASKSKTWIRKSRVLSGSSSHKCLEDKIDTKDAISSPRCPHQPLRHICCFVQRIQMMEEGHKNTCRTRTHTREKRRKRRKRKMKDTKCDTGYPCLSLLYSYSVIWFLTQTKSIG